MKKILSLLVGGLLIACMAGSTMAYPSVPSSGTTVITEEDLIQTENSEDTIVVPQNSQTSIALDFTDITIPRNGATVKISLSGSGFEVKIPKQGIFSHAYLNELTLTSGETISKSIYPNSQKTYDLEVVDKGATGQATLTVTVEKDGERHSCS